MAEIRINTTGGLKLYDADNSHYAQIVAGTITSNVDAITLGHDTVTIADNLSLASDSSIIKFGADSEITLTHSADSGLLLKHTATADDKPINLILQTGETDLAQDDVIGKISFQAPDEGTGTDAILVSAAIQARAEGDHSSSSNATSIDFLTGASEAAAKKLSITSAGHFVPSADNTNDIGTSSLEFKDGYFDGTLHCDVLDLAGTEYTSIGGSDPSSADGDSLGTASLEWSDLYLADGGIIYFGNDQDVTLTHDPDDGLFLKSIATADNNPVLLTLQTGETDIAADDVIGKISFQAPDEGTGTDAILVAAAIQATSEGDFSSSSNATKLEFMTGSSEAATAKMSISSGGIVGMGATLPGDLGVGLHIKTSDSGQSAAQGDADELVIESSGSAGLTILSGTSSEGSIHFGDSGASDQAQIMYNHNGDYMMFRANNGERMRMTSDGDLIVGGTALNAESALAIEVNAYNGAARISWNRASGQGGNTSVVQEFRHATSVVGSVSHTNSATTFATSSDYRLKENVSYTWDATTRLKQLKPARFNFKVDKDEDDKVTRIVDGFLAHEVSSIVPEAVVGEKDGAEMQGIDQAKLVPLLVKTIQELEARIKTLEDA